MVQKTRLIFPRINGQAINVIKFLVVTSDQTIERWSTVIVAAVGTV